MKLRTKIMMIALLPVLFLGIGIFILAANRIANGIYNMAYIGMQATAEAVKDIFEVENPGKYQMDENGNLWKGNRLNITEAVEIVDDIKNNTGIEVTIFWGDIRILTSIKNEAGERQVRTKAPEQVIYKVLQKGEDYFDKNVEILEKKYIAYYIPFYISEGNLTFEVDSVILKRSDEIGSLGRKILDLRNQLQVIVKMLQKKSYQLDLVAVELKGQSDCILKVMQKMEQFAQEMAGSCSNQAEDANIASEGVTSMGEMIGSNHTEIQKMHQISDIISNVSEKTRIELGELNKDMKTVRKSIDYLEQQTDTMKNAVDRIGSATEMIAGIASQTNLLSLNASIESARAGEQGKGFAVVASQIQKLSQQANEAVKDIKSMVDNLTVNSDGTIQRMEEVQVVIQNQEKSVQKTEQVFADVQNKIVESVNHMDMVIGKTTQLEEIRTDMVVAVQNSAAISEENVASIEIVMEMIQNIYKELKEISGKTNDLERLSGEMKEIINTIWKSKKGLDRGIVSCYFKRKL